MASTRLVLLFYIFFLRLESAFCGDDVNPSTGTYNTFRSTSGDIVSDLSNKQTDQQVDDSKVQTSEKIQDALKQALLDIGNNTNFTDNDKSDTQTVSDLKDTPTNSDDAKTEEKNKEMKSGILTDSSTTSSSISSTTPSSYSLTGTYYPGTYSASYLASTDGLAPPQTEERRCFTDAVLQNFCPVPNDLTDVSFWDLYSVLFSDTVLDALSIGCTKGSWCLQDRFDYWDALMAERVDMVTKSEISDSMCHSDIRSCIAKTVQNFHNCSMYPQMEFTTEALSLICDLKNNQGLPDTCFKHVITALHVSLADTMRSEEDYVKTSDDTCETPEAYMTGGLICVENSCPGEFDTFKSFRPWAWFTNVVNSLIEECDMDPTKCQALLQPSPDYLYRSELSTMIGASIATTVSALLLTISMCVCYRRYRRNAVIKDGYQKLLNDGDES